MDQIRLVNQDELEESLTLSEFAFQYSVAPEEREERLALLKADQIWGYFVDGRLAAKLTIIDLATWVNGEAFRMGGIAGVATWPEYRRKGMVGHLLSQALKSMKEGGQSVSFLAPFSFAFYRKFGWEAFIEYIRYEIMAYQLPMPKVLEGSRMQRIEPDPTVLNPIYEAYAKTYNGMLKRTEAWWNRRFFKAKKGIVNLYLNPAGEPEGYIYYQVKERVLTVHDMVALNEDASCGIWKFISNHDSMIDKVVCQAPMGDILPFLLAEPRIKQEIVPYFMARIVDVPTFLRSYAFTSRTDDSHTERPFFLRVQDEHAHWNNGLFRIVRGSSGMNEIVKLAEATGDENFTEENSEASIISCDVQTLSALLMGYKPASVLHRIHRLHGDASEIARLEQIIPERTTYLMDFF